MRFPDTVSARALLSAVNPPKKITTTSNGKISKPLKSDGDSVKQGELIGYIETTSFLSQITSLSEVLYDLYVIVLASPSNKKCLALIKKLSNFDEFGELQEIHEAFMTYCVEFEECLEGGFYKKKRAILNSDLKNNKLLKGTLLERRQLIIEDVEIGKKDFLINDSLHNDRIINESEFRAEKTKSIAKKMQDPDSRANLAGNQSNLNSIKAEILELDKDLNNKQKGLIQALLKYQNAIHGWEKKYLFISPIAGKLSFVKFFVPGQQIKETEEIASVAPTNSLYYVQMTIPQNNFGKVKVGDNVLFDFKSFPASEFGSVEGKIEYIKQDLTDSGYLAKVSLPNGLETITNKVITFHDGLLADAKIVVNDISFVDRLFFSFKK